MRSERLFLAVLACFLLSGFAALLYQTAWLRQFSLVFGTSELAVAAVLASYMAGLAVGAAVAGRLVAHIRRPIRVYGLLELGIALGALLVPAGLAAARHVHVALLGGQPEPPPAGGWTFSLLYLTAVFAVVAIPTACMGATLPLLAQFAVRRSEEIGSRVGLLYTVNTAGAVCGTLATAFVLLPKLGLSGTVLTGALVNALVFACSILIVRGSRRFAATEASPPASTIEDGQRLRRAGLILPMMLLSGAASFIYEVLWTRLLGHVLGASLYAFAVMLASFLTGITLGAAVASRLARTPSLARLGFMAAQLGTALLSIVVYLLLDRIPALAQALAAGESASLAANAAIASAVLLPSTLCIGATFPFAVRVLARSASEAAPAAARVFAWNTLGAIAGAILAAFVIIPGLGFDGTAKLAVSLNLLLALSALALERTPAWKLSLAGATAVLVLWAFQPAPPEDLMRASPFRTLSGSGRIAFSSIGRSATVLLLEQDGNYNLRINGLPEATILPRGHPPISGRAPLWLTSLPVLARPQARSMLVIGLGGGVALESVPPTVQAIDVLELEPAVIEANRSIAAVRRRDPLADPRLHVILNDARSALALTSKSYDVIVSQPSHPWTAGSSHLYTREFVRQVRDHLAAEGIFVQWISTELVDPTLLKTLGATLLSEFQHVRLYKPFVSELLFLASAAPIEPELQLARDASLLHEAPDVYGWLGLHVVEDLAARLLLDGEGLTRLCAGAPLNTDDRNYLALISSSFSSNSFEADLEQLLVPLDPLVAPDFGLTLDRVYTAQVLALLDAPRRGLRVARASQKESERSLGVGLVLAVEGKPEAFSAIRRAMQLNPADQQALFAFVEPSLGLLAKGQAAPDVTQAASRLVGPAAAVVAGWTHALAGRWDDVARLEERLAAARSTDLWYAVASQLRASWRTSVRTAERRRLGGEALAIIDQSLALNPLPRSLLVRAVAAQTADRPDELLGTANAVAYSIESRWKLVSDEERQAMSRIAGQILQHLATLAGDDRVAAERLEQINARLSTYDRSSSGAVRRPNHPDPRTVGPG